MGIPVYTKIVYSFVSNKRLNGWTDQFCVCSHMTPGKITKKLNFEKKNI